MTKDTQFYPDIRDHTSPSALAMFIENPIGFEKKYFGEEPEFTTDAMKNGKEVHEMIEGGFKKVQKVFECRERDGGELRITIPRMKGLFLQCRLDSWGQEGLDVPEFVDYKTGKTEWTQEKATADLKQKFNAWALWKHTGVKEIVGSIEHVLDNKPKGKTKVYTVRYTEKELDAIDELVRHTVRAVNAAYIEYGKRSDAFVQDDELAHYAELKRQEAHIKEQIEESSEIIKSQFEAGNLRSLKRPFGTFTIQSRVKYAYNPQIVNMERDLKAAKKKFEEKHDPVEISHSLSFTVAKPKNK